jgi:hypothetical protein
MYFTLPQPAKKASRTYLLTCFCQLPPLRFFHTLPAAAARPLAKTLMQHFTSAAAYSKTAETWRAYARKHAMA